MAKSIRKNYCRNCMAACGLVVETENNVVLDVRPDRDHPVTKGYMCVKGTMTAEWQAGVDRLLTPLKRQADGTLAPASPGKCLDEVAERVSRIIAAHGPRSVAIYQGTGSKMNTLGQMALRSWLKAIDSPYFYSSSTIDQSAKWVTQGRMGIFTTGKYDYRDIDAYIVVGSNPIVSHQGYPWFPSTTTNPLRSIREMKARGVKLIVMDPRKTELARLADIHLQLLPGEDVSVLAAMINVIFRNGWQDVEFCQRFATSVEDLREAVKDFTPELAAARAGIEAGQLVEAARLFATSRRRSIGTGTGPNMSLRSNLAEHLVESLNVICGVYRRAGDKVYGTGALAPRSEVREGVVPPHRSWEHEPKLWTEDSGMLFGEFPASRLPNEILDGGIRALIVVGGNPAKALGQPEKTLRALNKLELLVSLDPRMTETCRLSHYVMPVKMPHERYDTTHSMEFFHVNPYAQLGAPVVDAPAEVLDEWEVFWELAHRMNKQLFLAGKVFMMKADSQGYAVDMTHRPSSKDLLRALHPSDALASFDDLLAHPEGILLDSPPIIIQPALADDGARLDLLPADVATELAEVIGENVLNVSNSRYPYRLAVRRMVEALNSAFRFSSPTKRRWPVNPAFMNPADMAREGFENGDSIRIVSEHGKLIGKVRADPTVRAGVISMSGLWGSLDADSDPKGELGAFTGAIVSLDHDLDRINFMPRQSGIPVRAEIVDE